MSLIVEKIHSKVITLTLNRVDKHNALSAQFVSELNVYFEALNERIRKSPHTIRALVIQSASTKAFCAGADLKERFSMSEDDVLKTLQNQLSMMNSLRSISVPTIALMEGVAFGGGLELALHCDFIYAHPKAKMGLTETKLGIIPGAGGTVLLKERVGTVLAKKLIFSAEPIEAKRAFNLGIVDCCSENIQQDLNDFLEKIVLGAPLAIIAAKKALSLKPNQYLERIAFENLCYKETLNTLDRIEGLMAFKEKRTPNYEGR